MWLHFEANQCKYSSRCSYPLLIFTAEQTLEGRTDLAHTEPTKGAEWREVRRVTSCNKRRCWKCNEGEMEVWKRSGGKLERWLRNLGISWMCSRFCLLICSKCCEHVQMRVLAPQAHTRVGKWAGEGSKSGQSYWSQVRRRSGRRKKGTDQKQRQRKTTWLSTEDKSLLAATLKSSQGEFVLSSGKFSCLTGSLASSSVQTREQGEYCHEAAPHPAPVSLRELSPPFWWEKRNKSWLGGRLEDVERKNSRCRRW